MRLAAGPHPERDIRLVGLDIRGTDGAVVTGLANDPELPTASPIVIEDSRIIANQWGVLLYGAAGGLTFERSVARGNYIVGLTVTDTPTTIRDSRFVENGWYGVTVSLGTLEIRDSVLARNVRGGLLSNSATVVRAVNTRVKDSLAGFVASGEVHVEDSRFVRNGIGLEVGPFGDVTLERSVFRENGSGLAARAGSLIADHLEIVGGGTAISLETEFFGFPLPPDTSVLVRRSVIRGVGRVVFVQDGALVIEESLIKRNAMLGRQLQGSLSFVNSTLHRNTASGPLLETFGEVRFEHATVTRNEAPAGFWDVTADGEELPDGTPLPNGTVSFLASIVAQQELVNCSGPAMSLGGNVLQPGTCDWSLHAGDVVDAQPRLSAIAEGGGPTATRALRPGSPAVDLIPEPGCTVDFDQRGVGRPQGAGCDAGAFEREPD